MRTATLVLVALPTVGALAVAVFSGCSQDDSKKPSDQPPAELTFPYTPKGCDYQVALPDAAEEASGDRDVVGADPAPKHIHVSWAGASSSTVAVNWATDLDTRLTRVLYGTDKAGVEAADGPSGAVHVAAGHTMLLGSPLFTTQKLRVHEVHVCGLEPDTTYFYKVGGAGHWSQVYDTATAPPVGQSAPFRFAVTGDSRGSGEIFAQMSEQITSGGADFQVFTGDFIDNTANQSHWEQFFEGKSGSFATQDLIATRPLMPVNGNHDNLSVYYVGQFALPQDPSPGEEAQGEEWYSFDYANAHFVMLSSEGTNKDPQTKFLEEDLAQVDRGKTPWVFVAFHRAPYTCGSSHQGDSLAPRETWQPVFDKYAVDIVFTGHVHNYQRSLPIRGFQPGTTDGQVAQAGPNGEPVNGSGTVYVVSGGAAKDLYGTDPASTCYFSKYTEETHHYVMVDVDGNKLSYKAIRTDGSEMDAFSITK
ncbi:MAG: purple acid phosphatase [Myxococcales bacterium]|nr:purple acid phosphatase [Myxococcales bacterium]MCB9580125.1 purple acid phosphatase [Polyangiaceae bacterium]